MCDPWPGSVPDIAEQAAQPKHHQRIRLLAACATDTFMKNLHSSPDRTCTLMRSCRQEAQSAKESVGPAFLRSNPCGTAPASRHSGKVLGQTQNL
eukprot:1166764-Rhodomonas_salina.1